MRLQMNKKFFFIASAEASSQFSSGKQMEAILRSE